LEWRGSWDPEKIFSSPDFSGNFLLKNPEKSGNLVFLEYIEDKWLNLTQLRILNTNLKLLGYKLQYSRRYIDINLGTKKVFFPHKLVKSWVQPSLI